jgi:hypothetical protein
MALKLILAQNQTLDLSKKLRKWFNLLAWGNDLDVHEEDPLSIEDLQPENPENPETTEPTEQDTFRIEKVDRQAMEFFIVIAKLFEISSDPANDFFVRQVLETRLGEVQQDSGMKGLLEFEAKMTYVQFERLRSYFLRFVEDSVVGIIKNGPGDQGPLTKRIDVVRKLENFFFDREIVTGGGIWDSDYKPGHLNGICEKLCEERWVIDGDCVPKGRLLNDYFYRTKVDKSGLLEELKHEGSES